MPRGPGHEEQQRRDRAPDDEGRVLRPGETEQKGTTPRKVRPQEELGSNWRKVAEGGLELGLQGQVARHTPFQKGTSQRLTEEEALVRNSAEEAPSASTPS